MQDIHEIDREQLENVLGGFQSPQVPAGPVAGAWASRPASGGDNANRPDMQQGGGGNVNSAM